MPEDLITKLRAALDTAEHLAKQATAGPWRYNRMKHWLPIEDAEVRSLVARAGIMGEEFVGAGPADATIGVAATGPADHPQSMADAEFIAAWGPDRILALVARDRALLADYDRALAAVDESIRMTHVDDHQPYPKAAAAAQVIKAEVRRAAEFWLGSTE